MLEDHQPAAPGAPQSAAELPASVAPADTGAAPAAVPASGHAAGRIRRLAGHGHEWLISEQARLQARRQRSGLVDAGFLVQELDARVGGGILAGALAFRIFLFMVPVVYVIFTVLGVISRALGHDPAQLASDAGITGVLAGTVVKVADQSAWTLATLALGAVVTMLITAGSLLKALYVVHWLIWRIPRVKPPGLTPKLALIGLAVAGSALGVAINDVRTAVGGAGAVLTVLLTIALSFAGWWWVSWRLPHAPVPPRALIPGAVLMAGGAVVLQLLTTYWIGNLVARKTSTYGAVGIALAVLLWVYILGRIMVGSAGLNAALYYRRENSTSQTGHGLLTCPAAEARCLPGVPSAGRKSQAPSRWAHRSMRISCWVGSEGSVSASPVRRKPAFSYRLMAAGLALLTHSPMVLAPWASAHARTARTNSVLIPLPRRSGATHIEISSASTPWSPGR
jgi:uncharacterized BrkB/YihY/UPF0761 family membrane protein